MAARAIFGCVPVDAGYGKAAEFRRGLPERDLTRAVGVLPTLEAYPADVAVAPVPPRARPSVPAVLRFGGLRREQGRRQHLQLIGDEAYYHAGATRHRR